MSPEAARKLGHSEAMVGEVARMMEIMMSSIAAIRPRAAWMMLPQGLPIEETLTAIAEMPIETDADRAGFHEQAIIALGIRRTIHTIIDNKDHADVSQYTH